MTFTPEQLAQLNAPLARENVMERTQAGRQLSYLESWLVIAEANRIFGFDGWTRETVEMKCVSERPRKIRDREGWGVSYCGKVRVTVHGIVREGTGAGHGIDMDLGLAHESAIKECESDAMKRAFMTFGNQFGLALYDKRQSHVTPEFDMIALADDGKAAAAKGSVVLREWWIGLPTSLRAMPEVIMLKDKTLKPIAAEADAAEAAA